MIAKETGKISSLTGWETFSRDEGGLLMGITECSEDKKLQGARIARADNENTEFINRSNITLNHIYLESSHDLTPVYELPKYFLADAKRIEAFIRRVRHELEERDSMIHELQFELEKLNKKRKLRSAGYRLPKDYYENDAYIVE
jgi:hypothetical protein